MSARGSCLVVAALIAATTFVAVPGAAQVAAPGNVTATPMKGVVVVSWRGVRDATVSYRVLRGPDAVKPGQDLTKPLPGDAASYNDVLPIMGTVYYTVVAVYRDGSEGASAPVQLAATAASAPVAPMPTPTVSSRLTAGAPRMGPAVALRATPVTSVVGPPTFWVTLSWAPIVTAAPEPVTYVVRRSPYDPATVPPSYLPGFVPGTPALKAGVMTLTDRNRDRENPAWYMVVATSTSQGSVNFPWYRLDPTPHHGVDTIIGHYWQTPVPGSSGTWTGCVLGSPATDAIGYAARLKVGSLGWVTISTPPVVNGQPAGPGMNIAWFDTGRYHTLAPPLNAGYVPQIQMWPILGASTVQGGGMFTIADTMHLAPLVYSLTQSPTPLNTATCS